MVTSVDEFAERGRDLVRTNFLSRHVQVQLKI